MKKGGKEHHAKASRLPATSDLLQSKGGSVRKSGGNPTVMQGIKERGTQVRVSGGPCWERGPKNALSNVTLGLILNMMNSDDDWERNAQLAHSPHMHTYKQSTATCTHATHCRGPGGASAWRGP